jgi:formyl-CoA transferase
VSEVDRDPLFAGLKVLDVGTWIAAPMAATVLGDLGADVIKVEQPGVGDAYRGYAVAPATPKATGGVNYTWALGARNKRSVTLNLKSAEGRDILLRLVRDCDVYVTNHPGNMRRALGLTWEDLSPLNARLIYASLTAYGEKGPERDREGFDLVAYWARSGLMDIVRSPDNEPAQAIAGMGDHPTAMALYASIVTALLRRERTGKGAHVHTSLLANAVWSAGCLAQSVFAGAALDNIRRPARQHFTRAVYCTRDDRWLQMTMLRTIEEFDRLLLALDRSDILLDPRFETMEARFEHGAALTAIMRGIFAERTAAEWMPLFAEHDVPVALVGRLEDLPHDEQVAVNGMVPPPVEDVGVPRVIRDPMNVDGVRRVGAKRPPELGEHTDAVLRELGYDDAGIARLRADGVI